VDAGLALGPKGGIQVDASMRTVDPSIYAVGDAVEVQDVVTGADALIPLAGPANRQGRIAADNICGLPSRYAGTQGTAIARVFDVVIGMTGASEKSLRAAGRVYEKAYLHPNCHASYYPGAAALHVKVLFDPDSGRLLGGQAVGSDGVDKRVDVLAVALRAGMTVYDLEELELSYAPPFGSAKDPINFAGFVAANVLEGRAPLVHGDEVAARRADQLLVDVRTPREFAAGHIDGAVNIPLDHLRDRLSELPAGQEILVYCRVGLRGYLAQRILTQHGRRARNLSGGFLTWQAWSDAQSDAGRSLVHA
jgi:rhodanese-related sulfurtransferase